MRSIPSLIKVIAADHPQFTLLAGPVFQWSAQDHTITYNPVDTNAIPHLLHELGHALLDHGEYHKDVALIALERDAWDYAQNVLAPRYEVIVSDDHVQDALDSYRDWLHARSTCPRCTATGLQVKHQLYQCLACTYQWRVNEARMCALRRYRAA